MRKDKRAVAAIRQFHKEHKPLHGVLFFATSLKKKHPPPLSELWDKFVCRAKPRCFRGLFVHHKHGFAFTRCERSAV